MARPFIVMGDITGHGGTLIDASGLTNAHGKRIARAGGKGSRPAPLPGADLPDAPSRLLGLARDDLGVAGGFDCLAPATAHNEIEPRPVLEMTGVHPHQRAAFALAPAHRPAAAAGPAAA
ncbi:hypothetical protein [Eleftheria terrae]|uniref:hypothetical protein n=1 Tax=Eleftheria terrae TaxID=1597781 RepID=UPI00263ACE48|nr:hypothetical protein [Eleftheria terrae]WKB52774.1 hypothetical protein N7L95_23855 [Eleftheria terrae]